MNGSRLERAAINASSDSVSTVRSRERAGTEPASGAEAESLLFMEFLCWIKLGRLADASRVLETLHKLAKDEKALDYSDMVFSVESGAKDADARLAKLLSGNEANAFYYLAKRLAKGKRFGEALSVLARLGRKVNVQMAPQLASSIRAAQEASRV